MKKIINIGIIISIFCVVLILVLIIELLSWDHHKLTIEKYIPKNGDELYPIGGYREVMDNRYEYTSKNIKYNDFQIYNSFQPGIYSYDAWVNVDAKGYLYLKVYDLISNESLSNDTLEDGSKVYVEDTNGNYKKFTLEKNFKIHEGDWGDYYSARFELWYVPLEPGAGGTKKLKEDFYIIEGWER